jgi:mannose-1-phosphate guanylyltransferase
VLAWAALEIGRLDPSAVMISLHADHVIEPANVFRDQLARVARASVAHNRLFTLGAVPTRPERGFGYIHLGQELEEGMYAVDGFVEKPERATAERYVAEGYLWNTGIFVWPVSLFLDELRAHTPEVAGYLPLLEAGRTEEFFRRVPVITIDEGLLERSKRVAVARAAFRWDDVGTWDALARTRAADMAGNVTVGDAHVVESGGCIAWAEEGAVVIFGAQDLVVVRAAGITFVAPRARTADLKQLLAQLPDHLVQPDGADS